MGLTRQIGAADLDARSAPRRGEERSDESSERNGSCATDARSAPRRGEERSDESNQVFGDPRSPARIQYGIEERCQSGRMGLTRNQVYGSPYRGFESHPLRQQIKKEALVASFFVCRMGVLEENPPGSSRGRRSRPRRRAASEVSERPLDGLARRASQSHPLRQPMKPLSTFASGCWDGSSSWPFRRRPAGRSADRRRPSGAAS